LSTISDAESSGGKTTDFDAVVQHGTAPKWRKFWE